MATGPSEIHEIFDGFLHLSWRPWRELSAIAVMLMELSWSVAWLQFLAAPEQLLTFGKTYIFLGLWMAIAYSLARGMHFLRLHINVRRVFLLALFLVGVLALMKIFFFADRSINAGIILLSISDAFKNTEQLLPLEIIVISFAGYLWNRGINIASEWIDARYAAHRFRLGVIMLFALGILASLRRMESLFLGVVLFLCSSLLAISAARASTIELLRGGRVRLFDAKWLFSIAMTSTGVVLLAWLLGRFATAQFGDLFVTVFFFLIRILLILGLLIVSPLVFIIFLLFPLLEQKLQVSPLFQEIKEQVVLIFEHVMEVLGGIGELFQGFWQSLADLSFLKPAALWLFVGLLLMWVLRTVGIQRRRGLIGEGVLDTPESISESGERATWFRKILESSVGKLSERLSMLRRSGRFFGAMRVRMIYARLMRLCEEFECPRSRVQTPLEFLPTLRGLFPEHFVEIALITQAYNRVRYGEVPEERMDIQKVEDAWRRVREQANNLRHVQKALDNEP